MPHLSGSHRVSTFLIIVALIGALGFGLLSPQPALAAADYSAWKDLGIVYTAPSGRAYYPSVVYDANGFGSGGRLYKLWYGNGSGGVFVITSANGFSWSAPSAVSGLHAGAHHVQVLYDANCFGALPCNAATVKYKVWYWVGTMTYTITDLATAQSADGITWTNDTTLTQSVSAPLVTGGGSGWNRGSYGPSHVSYQASASNIGTEPWNYSYVMYYDGNDGSSEVTGLAYSADGLYWTGYAGTPVLNKSAGNAWDCDDAVYGTVYHNAAGYHYWYGGGGGDNGSGGCLTGAPNNQGIGYASSPDGIVWTKSPSNPIFHINQGVSYRTQRVYTPNVVDDGSGVLKMYYSAVGTDGGYKIGLALNALAPQVVFVDDNWVGLTSLTQVTFPGDPDPHFIGVDAFATIQAGVNAVTAGGTVKVATGTYTENVVISQSLTLAGAGQSNTLVYPALSNPDCRFGGSTVLCTGAPTTSASIMALVQANNVVIHDLTFDGDNPALTSGVVVASADLDARGGIITNQPAGTFNGLQIYNTTVKNIYLRGIQIFNYSTGFNVHDNRIENVKGDPNMAIAIFNRYGSGVFANNIISGTSDGVSSNWSSGTQYLTNTIMNSDSGVHSDNNGGAGGVADLIQGNQVINCTPGGYGVWVFAPYVGTNVQDNTVSGCDTGLGVFGQNAPSTVNFVGNHITGQAGSKGVYVTTDQLGFGSNNVSSTFTNNQIDNNTDGFYLESQVGYHLDVVAAQNTVSGNATAVNLVSAGTANAVIKGNTFVTETTVFSQTGGALIAYANSIGNFTAGLVDNGGGTANLKHNWWSTYADPAPSGLSASDWQARLGAPIQSWIDGSNSATLGNASLTGGAGIAVIVSHGRGLVHAPFGNGVTPHADNMCSDFYDFFTVNGSGNWNVSVPVDNTTACNSQTLNPGKVFWIPYTTTYSVECTPTNPACWDLIATNVITGGQNIVVANLSAAELGGTPFVAGSDGGNAPTAITLVSFSAVPTASYVVAVLIIIVLIASTLTATLLLIRRNRFR